MVSAMDNTTQSNTTESSCDDYENALRQVIFGDDESDPLNILLYDLVSCNTTSALAATDFLTIAHESQDLESCFLDLTVQTTSLASEYPSLHIYLVDLIRSIMHSKPANFPSAMRASFINVFSIGLGDLTQSNYGHLYEAEQRRRNPRLGEEHIYLNRFIARLLSALGEPQEPKEGLTHVQDALFIVSTALEDHAASHKVPDVDVPAAAQYVIHAGVVVFGECKKGAGRDLATTSPLWATSGKLWTGPPGLSLERWGFWKSRFEEFAKSGDHNISDETKKTASTAVRAMALIEARAD